MSRFITLFIFIMLVTFAVTPALAVDDIISPQPTEFTPIAPAADAEITNASGYVKNFQWTAIDKAEWYHLVIVKGAQIQFDQWYQASAVCEGEVCTSADELWLAEEGEYTWWMSHWNESIGNGYIHLYKKSTFSINMPLPQPPVSANSPSGSTNDTTPNLNWHNGSNALWYQVWVGPADYSSTSYQGWHERTAVCSTELDLCGIVMPNVLSAGDYEFWMQSWNPAGSSEWVKLGEFTVTQSFVIKS